MTLFTYDHVVSLTLYYILDDLRPALLPFSLPDNTISCHKFPSPNYMVYTVV